MRFAILFLAGLAVLPAAEVEPLVKVGDYHLQTARYGAAVVADGNYVYVVGGDTGREFLGDIERFDINTHEVVRLTERLAPRAYPGAVVADGRIYVFGGASATPLRQGDRMEPTVDVFDLSSGQITQAAPMPTARSYAATVLFKGQVYVIGGIKARGRSAAQTGLVEIYNLATNRWSTGPSMPTARECRGAVVDDFILVPGGYRNRARVAQVEFFVPAENAWKRLPDLCKPVSACAVAFLGSHLFLFGNYSDEQEVVAYELRTRTSRVISPGFRPARHTAAVAHAGRIYVIGGLPPGGSQAPFDDIQVFAPPAP